MRPPRRCLDCGALTPTSRCPDCTRHRKQRRNAETDRARQLVRDHVAQRGWVCPGWQRDPHESYDLTADHLVAFTHGGTLADGAGILCRTCNARRG